MQASAAHSALENLPYLPKSDSLFAVSAYFISTQASLRIISLFERDFVSS